MLALASLMKEGRAGAEMTLTEAAKKLGIHHMTLSKIENGKYAPKPSLLAKARAVYGLEKSVEELMNMAAKPEDGLTNDEMSLVLAYRSRDIDAIIKRATAHCFGE